MDYRLSRNEWESRFFQREIAQLHFLPSETVSEAAESYQARLIQAKVPTNAFEQVAFLQQQGFHLVETEATFCLAVEADGATPLSHSNQAAIIPATPAHLSALQPFSHAFAHSRFRPPYFSAQENQRFYRQWIENAVNGVHDHACFLAQNRSQNEIEGFVSIRLVEDEAKLGLLAVAPNAKRQGVARRLFEQAKSWAAQQGATHLWISTQLSNTAALACYQAVGAKLSETAYWFYKQE